MDEWSFGRKDNPLLSPKYAVPVASWAREADPYESEGRG